MTDTPDPSNDTAMGELHKFVCSWAEKYKLSSVKENYYLSLYLSGRLGVQFKLEHLKEVFKDEDQKQQRKDN